MKSTVLGLMLRTLATFRVILRHPDTCRDKVIDYDWQPVCHTNHMTGDCDWQPVCHINHMTDDCDWQPVTPIAWQNAIIRERVSCTVNILIINYPIAANISIIYISLYQAYIENYIIKSVFECDKTRCIVVVLAVHYLHCRCTSCWRCSQRWAQKTPQGRSSLFR